jgi:hypothetical protein
MTRLLAVCLFVFVPMTAWGGPSAFGTIPQRWSDPLHQERYARHLYDALWGYEDPLYTVEAGVITLPGEAGGAFALLASHGAFDPQPAGEPGEAFRLSIRFETVGLSVTRLCFASQAAALRFASFQLPLGPGDEPVWLVVAGDQALVARGPALLSLRTRLRLLEQGWAVLPGTPPSRRERLQGGPPRAHALQGFVESRLRFRFDWAHPERRIQEELHERLRQLGLSDGKQRLGQAQLVVNGPTADSSRLSVVLTAAPVSPISRGYDPASLSVLWSIRDQQLRYARHLAEQLDLGTAFEARAGEVVVPARRGGVLQLLAGVEAIEPQPALRAVNAFQLEITFTHDDVSVSRLLFPSPEAAMDYVTRQLPFGQVSEPVYAAVVDDQVLLARGRALTEKRWLKMKLRRSTTWDALPGLPPGRAHRHWKTQSGLSQRIDYPAALEAWVTSPRDFLVGWTPLRGRYHHDVALRLAKAGLPAVEQRRLPRATVSVGMHEGSYQAGWRDADQIPYTGLYVRSWASWLPPAGHTAGVVDGLR